MKKLTIYYNNVKDAIVGFSKEMKSLKKDKNIIKMEITLICKENDYKKQELLHYKK